MAAAAVIAGSMLSHEAASLPLLGTVPAFAMVDQNGAAFTDQNLRGRVWIIDFFFASCTSSCPKLAQRMVELQKAVSTRERAAGRELPIDWISITLDPDNDTPAVLHA